MPHSKHLSSIEDIIEDARNGRMFILVDDEERENEGDLVIPAQMATPDAINFMAKYGRGLICLTLTPERVEELGLPLMAQHNDSRHQTAFTVSIEAREGVTTGISASDRARTIAAATDPTKGKDDIASPGHIFPLEARDGGVLVRAGHTEAAVDVSRMAGLNPSGVICEIMNEDGTMARLPDLIEFAQKHELNIGTIADLIAYRLKNDSLIERVVEAPFESVHGGEFKMAVYVNRIAYAEHVALIKGDIQDGKPVPVRMHTLNALDDVLGDASSGKAGELSRAMDQIGAEGRGVIVLIREPSRTGVSDMVRHKIGEDVQKSGELRDYGVGAQILLDLGVKDMILLSNTQKTIVGLEGYGLSVVEQRPIKSES
ncbi:MAG: 3,4-dihydroxy-2-butanone-4-phosphate synthase [Rhodospirillaceae bacterium]|nr:3,4-dihydroxy-2-butanone-4-phosphate synthase [Rhodospirillaceae bacterium]MBT4219099.1 3,4-dihydroxy-2-butanone-4-phosphate synthase [Rhodospirillaceae bacterium]MBT5014383.1 3,4-dihydroxy-2-butanone-4-phosphate synthase [Rhodospirillaceae bacterium]MBT5308589.1 3,4-dihydroxy-2-butanone-4-phosphate synthase [Rhodospirillaceae bacterium]MBT6407774.1 3,4-dihydroxy-2-butanone-4-phosphate synthase [Rhodospirillaceae bacterium]